MTYVGDPVRRGSDWAAGRFWGAATRQETTHPDFAAPKLLRAAAMFERWCGGATYTEIAREFKLNRHTVGQYVRRESERRESREHEIQTQRAASLQRSLACYYQLLRKLMSRLDERGWETSDVLAAMRVQQCIDCLLAIAVELPRGVNAAPMPDAQIALPDTELQRLVDELLRRTLAQSAAAAEPEPDLAESA